jgi:hypothetical protein
LIETRHIIEGNAPASTETSERLVPLATRWKANSRSVNEKIVEKRLDYMSSPALTGLYNGENPAPKFDVNLGEEVWFLILPERNLRADITCWKTRRGLATTGTLVIECRCPPQQILIGHRR